MDEIVVLQPIKGGLRADQPAAHGAPGQELRGGRAVVGALAGVFGRAAPEFGIGEKDYPVPVAARLGGFAEGGEARGEIAEQASMLRGLVDMGIETAER